MLKFQGKPVLEVLEEFSTQGLNLLYSSNYIPPTMMVLSEPASHEPLLIVDEILKPHGLKLKNVDGNYLVVKFMSESTGNQSPSLLIIISNRHELGSLDELIITTEPEVSQQTLLGPGLYQLFFAGTGDYVINVHLPGYRTSRSVVRIEGTDTESLIIELPKGESALEIVSVSASRYIFRSNSKFVIDQLAIQALPHSGEDPIRAVQRLPGTAASGYSSKSHFRGGLLNESSIYLNGAQLLEPFHIRNFHSIFSSIDARAISRIEVYTGSLPIEYGGDMSGVTLLDSKIPEESLHTELGLSFFYTSVLNSGHSGDQRYDWLVSARLSNLDYVLDPDYGSPEYFDVFASLGFNATPNTRISLNGLYTDDEITIYTENDPEQLEESVSKTSNKSAWLRMENSWGDNLSADTTISSSYFSNRREARVEDPLEMVSHVFDYREIRLNALRHSMQYDSASGHILRWGLEYSRQSAVYDYAGQAEYFGLVSGYPGIENPVTYQIQTDPNGSAYAAYLSDRFELNSQVSLELGLRWDKQTYTDPNYSGQLSPRASMLYSFAGGKELRFSAGRYFQAQRIEELQVEDNIDHFFEPQYSDQFIAGYQWGNSSGYDFRVEAYYKQYNRLAPRFENLFDSLQMAPEFQLDRVRLDPTSATVKGLEFTVEYRKNKEFNWWALYTLSKATDTINGNTQRRSWDQLHAFQFGLGWQRGAWQIGFTTRVHTGWPTTGLGIYYPGESGEPVLIPGPRNAERFGAFASLDFRVSRQFDVHTGQLTGFVEVVNTTNRDNPCCTDYGVEEGPNGNLAINEIVQYWYPIIPSIGVVWEF